MKPNSKKKKKKTSKVTIAIIVLILAALLLLGVFLTTYYLFMDKTLHSYENNMKSIVNAIKTTNKSSNRLVEDNSISKKAVDELPKIIDKLDGIKEAIDAEVPGAKFTSQHAALSEGVKSNILMYSQILNILKSPNSSDIKTSVEDFKKFRDEAETYYSEFTLNNTTLSVLEDSNNFLKNFQFFANQLIKIKNNSDIKTKQNLEFVNNVDSAISKFLNIKTDFSIDLKKARSNATTFDAIIDTANDYKEKNSQLEIDLRSISVPENCKDIQSKLLKIFEDYDLYIQDFILSVGNEKSQTAAPDDSKLKEIYFDSNNRYLSLEDKYNNFIKQFSDFKSTTIK